MSSTDRSTSTKLFHEKLSMLNDNFIRFLQKEYTKKPNADLTPVLNDYLKHLRDLDLMYSLPADSDFSASFKNSQVDNSSSTFPISTEKKNLETPSTTTSASTTSTTSTIPSFPLVSSLTSKTNLFGSFHSSAEKPNLEITSTTTTASTITTTSAIPSFSFGSSSAPKPNLFGSFPTSAEKPNFEITSTTTSTIPKFSFGSMSSKPNLFGSFSAFSNSETVKDNEENEGEETDERPEEFTPKDNFQPIVPLPSKVETKSGEESEEVIYETRCRLFRFDKSAKEFRARGTGDIKILLNKQTNRYRCIARNSEAISKIITNFTLFSNFKIEKKEEKPTCLIWRCKDFSEGKENNDETFLAKFRDEETSQKFKEKVEDIVKQLKS